MSDAKNQKLFICVNSDNNNNKFYYMCDNGDGTWTAVWGRVKGALNPDVNELKKVGQSKVFPMSEWDKKIVQKSRPRTHDEMYKDMTHLFVETSMPATQSKSSQPQPTKISDDIHVTKMFTALQSYANKSIQQNYTVSTRNVTQAMVDEAQNLVDEIAKLIVIGSDINKLNKQLLDLFHVIPRRMGNVKDELFKPIVSITEYNKMDYSKKSQVISLDDARMRMKNEQDTLDVMANQVKMLKQQYEQEAKLGKNVQAQLNLLEQLGLEIMVASQKEFDEVRKFMTDGNGSERKLNKLFKVINKETEGKYMNHINSAKNKEAWLMFHGSRNQNWLNIVQTGLLIRPAGAIHTGSMFGDGVYGARQARKAINYTSTRGSYWARGNDDKAYLGIFEFHVGNQKHIKHHDSSCYSLNYQKIQKDGFDSVYAHGGADLINDEFIVYTTPQATIKYLAEIS